MLWLALVLVLWVGSGLLGWAWANHVAYHVDGPDRYDPVQIRRLLRRVLFFGPTLILATRKACRIHGWSVGFGLRFRTRLP